MDTIFMKSGTNKISDPQRLLLNLSDKINLQGSDKYALLSFTIHGNMLIKYAHKICSFTIHGKI